MGLDGKTCIHPGQVPIANEVFGPDKEEISWAKKIVEAFAAPDATGLEVMRLAGRMVERLHERQAKRTLQFADAITALEQSMKDLEITPPAAKTSRPLITRTKAAGDKPA
jgi:citrate lyase subunit beta/citryl-CoA lyase